MFHDDRYARGLEIMQEVQGRDGAASILEGLGAMHPDLPGYVVEDGFADVYARPGLDLGRRQLVTVAALATLGGCERQLAVHVRGALNVGVSRRRAVRGAAPGGTLRRRPASAERGPRVT